MTRLSLPTIRRGLPFMWHGLVLVCLLTSVRAQYRFDSWTTTQGLPQNSVTAIVQTRDGYLWFTTIDGLVRFDGVRFTVFDRNNTKAITSNRFTCLLEDIDGTLWAGTEYGGMVRYRNGVFSALTVAQGLPTNNIQELRPNPSGGVFIRYADGYGLIRDDQFTPLRDPLSNPATTTFIAPNNTHWQVASLDIRRAITTKQFAPPPPSAANRPVFFGDLIERCELLFVDRQNRWWGNAGAGKIFSVQQGALHFYNAKEGLTPPRLQPSERLHEYVNIAAEDQDGTLWFGTGAGLLCFRDGRFTRYTTKDGLADNVIDALWVDRENIVWIGTRRGLTRVTKQTIASISTEEGLPYKVVNPILQDRNDDVWVGSYILSRYSHGKITNYLDHLNKHPRIQSLYEDPQGVLWVGGIENTWRITNGHVESFANTNFVTANNQPTAPTCFAFWQDRNRNFWFGTEQGLFQRSNGKMEALALVHSSLRGEIRVIHEYRAGQLWFGAATGLAQWKDENFAAFAGQEHFQNERVRALYEDSDGALWVGTYDNGLRRLKNGRVTVYKIENGLANNQVFQILADAYAHFWISSNKGIYRVSKQQLDDFADGKITAVTSVAYGVMDGMRNVECNTGRSPAGMKMRDGKLWFPTQDGIAIVDSAAVPHTTLPPPVTIDNILVNQQASAVPTTLVLHPGDDNLEIIYTGLSLLKPEQIKFQYKLEGLDRDWVDAGTRRAAYYSHLNPGTYQFHVQAVNSAGVWSATTATLAINVIPPFYRTWWFYLLLALAFGALLYGLYWYRIRQLRHVHSTREAFSQQLLTMQETFAQQLIQSQESERQRIAAELHDGLGQNLLVIKNRMLYGVALVREENVKKHFTEIDTIVAATLQEVRSIAQHLHPPQLALLGLTAALEEMMDQFAASGAWRVATNIAPINGLLAREAELNIFRICQESLNNIIKHAQASQIEFTVARNADRIEITIQDNGQGCDVAAIGKAAPRGSGWLSMHERVRILRGEYHIKSAPAAGTTIALIIPILPPAALSGAP